jgi:hypothetical protein
MRREDRGARKNLLAEPRRRVVTTISFSIMPGLLAMSILAAAAARQASPRSYPR